MMAFKSLIFLQRYLPVLLGCKAPCWKVWYSQLHIKKSNVGMIEYSGNNWWKTALANPSLGEYEQNHVSCFSYWPSRQRAGHRQPQSCKFVISYNQQEHREFTFQLFSFVEQTLQMRAYLKPVGYNLHHISLNKNICIIKSKIKWSSS